MQICVMIEHKIPDQDLPTEPAHFGCVLKLLSIHGDLLLGADNALKMTARIQCKKNICNCFPRLSSTSLAGVPLSSDDLFFRQYLAHLNIMCPQI